MGKVTDRFLIGRALKAALAGLLPIPHGQLAQFGRRAMIGQELGVPLEDVEVVHGDTGRVPFGMGTYGSRSAAVGGSALVKSAEKVRAKDPYVADGATV